jgi:tetratricopeptide (TPR) repeat protein
VGVDSELYEKKEVDMSKSSMKMEKSKQPSQEYINQLMTHFQQGKYSEILKQEKDLKSQYPESVMIWKVLGAANFSLNNLEEAVKDFKVVLKLSPNDVDAMNNLGLIYKNNLHSSISQTMLNAITI